MNTRRIRFRVNFQKVWVLALGWAMGMFVMALYEFSVLGTDGVYPNGVVYDYRQTLWLTPLTALIAGLALGSFEIFFVSQSLRRRSFGSALLIKSILYFLIIYLFIAAGVNGYNMGIVHDTFWSKGVLAATGEFLWSPYSFIIVMIWSLTFILMLFILQVSDKFGQGMLKDFMLGKYHQPKIEKRIFMFLDMRSSTMIAERLGHLKYFQLLNDFFDDLTNPIVYRKGEIYQYVGDEVVVSWRMRNGIEHANCIRCFFEIEDHIKNLSATYEEKYGLVPGFKAGFYFGDVTTGEIGVIKKEIIFTGDVLNTTARIQGMCNQVQANLLISTELYALLKDKLGNDFVIEEIGEVSLRGRTSQVELLSVSKVPANAMPVQTS